MKHLNRFLLGLFPRYFLVQARFELQMLLVRTKSHFIRQKHGDRDLLVNLGCGSAGVAGWVNVDGAPDARVNLVYDIRKRVPLPTGSAAGVFCEHFLEHLDFYEEVPRFMSECLRILKAGGTARFIVPDAEKYLMAYSEGGWEKLTAIRPLVGQRKDYWFGCTFDTRMELINLVFRQGVQHKFAYDWETLAAVLRKAGFATVRRVDYSVGAMKELCLDKAERSSESLYVEAVK